MTTMTRPDEGHRVARRLVSLLRFRWTPSRVLIAATVAVVLVVTVAVVAVLPLRREPVLLDCLEVTVLPCEAQSFDLLVPVSGTPVRLSYSSQRQLGPEPVTRWLGELGLGGWTLDVVHRLDPSEGLLHLGDGTSQRAHPVEVTAGPHAGLLAVADRAGDVVHLFDQDGRHLRTVDALDGRVDYSIEYADGRLSAITDDTSGLSIARRDDGEITIDSSAGGTTRLTRDGEGWLTSIRDAVGAEWQLEPGRRGLIQRAVLPDGGSYLLSYDGDGRLVAQRDPAGVTTRWRRGRVDGGYLLIRTESSGASSGWTLVRSGDGAVTATATGTDGLTTRELVRARGRTVTWPDGTTLRMRLAPDPRWGDQLPRAAEVRLAVPGAPEVVTASSVEVSGGGADPFAVTAVEETWTRAGSTYTTRWDAATRRLSTTTPEGRTAHLTLDRSGRTAAVAWGDGYEHRVSYDTAGQPVAVEWGDGSRIDLGYLDGAVELTSPADFHHRVELDAAGRVSRARISEVGEARVHRRDDGALVAVEPGDARARRLELTPDGEPLSFTPGSGPEMTTWAYDAHGRLTGLGGGGQEVRVGYDAASRPVELSTGGDTFRYAWDGASGQLASLDGEAVRLGFEYAGPLLTGESWRGAVAGSVRTRLDELLRVREIEVGGTRIPVDYDADGLLVGVGATSVVRDGASGLVTRLAHGEVTEERSYDQAGALATVEVTAGGSTVYRMDLARDQLGRVVQRREQVGGQPARERGFAYDRFGQLVEVSVDGRVTESYHYDDRGNRVRATVDGQDRRATVDDADRLLSDGDTTFSYTGDGRLAGWTDRSGTLALSYDGLGNLLRVEPPAGPVVSYAHDGRSRRVARQHDGAPAGGMLYLDGQRPAATTGPDGGVDAVFTYAGDQLTPTAMIRDGRAYRIVSDHTGSPRLVIDTATGEIAQRLEYDAFGVVVEDTRPGWQPFRFGGGILDPASGLVRFGARDYDPRTGRWTAPDPLLYEGGDANLYRYAANDPVNRTDPTGLDPRRRKNYMDGIGLAIGIVSSPIEGTVPEEPVPEIPSFQEPRADEQRRPESNIRPRPRPWTPPPPPPPPPPGPSKGGWDSWRAWKPPAGGWRYDKYRSWGWRRHGGMFGLACLSPYDCVVSLHTANADFARELGEGIGGLDVDLPGGEEEETGQSEQDRRREPRFSCGTIDECLAGGPSGHIKGEPHIRTLDGLGMSFQAAGEFVYVASDLVEVQTRFEGEVGRNTRTTATAVRVGSHTIEVHYDDVKADRDGIRLPVRIDGEPTTIDDQVRDLDGMRVVAVRDGHRDIVYVESPDGWLVAVENLHVSQNVLVVAGSAATAAGLAGTPNGDRTDDLRRRDGSVLPLDTLDTVRGRYGILATEWRVRPDERLFTDTPAQQWLTDEFTALPDVILSLGDLPADKVRAAREACVEAGVAAGSDLEDCTYDVAVSGDDDWAGQQADSHTARRSDAGERRPADDPLFVAADHCRDDDLAALIAGGADVTVRRSGDGWTALMFASQRDCPDTVSMLLAAGADPGAVATGDGAFALYLAAQNGRTEVVRVLLDAGATPDQALPAGDTPLLIAAFREHADVISVLVDAGTDPDVARSDGTTPIMAAAQEGDLASLRAIIDAGADVDRATFEDGTTALHLSASDDHTDVVSMLLAAGAHVDKPSLRGDTALHYAAARGADGVIRVLLAAGADPTHRNDRGHTPADVADESVAHLLDH